MLGLSDENLGDGFTISGGSWQPALPQSNLQQTLLAKVARTVDLLSASTRIDIDALNASNIIRAIGCVRHNLSTNATWRVTAGTTPGGSDVYDSGTIDAWPRIYQYSDLFFEDVRWWLGKPSASEVDFYKLMLMHDCGGNILARYWRIQINDASNPDGYVELARLWVGPLWSTLRSYIPGAGLDWEPRDRAAVSKSGVRYSYRNRGLRVFSFALDFLEDGEAWGRMLDMKGRLGSEGELLVIPELDSLAFLHKRWIFGRIRRSSPVQQQDVDRQTVQIEVEEFA